MNLRRRIFLQLTPEAASNSGLPLTIRIVLIVIVTSVCLAIFETEEQLVSRCPALFYNMNIMFGVFFTLEFLLRLWTAGEKSEYAGLAGRLRFLIRPVQIIDFAALVPFFLTAGVTDAFVLRLVRLARIITLAKLGRYTRALDTIRLAISSRGYELVIGIGLAFLMMLLAATVMYVFERRANPEHFGSIPRAMWWGVATVTKVGYGGAFPETAIGRASAGFLSLSAIAVLAVPTGILAGAFAEAFRTERLRRNTEQPK